MQAPAERRGDAGRSSSTVSTPNARRASRLRTSRSRPAARITSWSSSYLSTEPSVRSTAAASSRSTPSSSSAATQSIASAIPGGFCTSLSRMRETAFATWTASVSEAPLTRRRTISTSRSGDG